MVSRDAINLYRRHEVYIARINSVLESEYLWCSVIVYLRTRIGRTPIAGREFLAQPSAFSISILLGRLCLRLKPHHFIKHYAVCLLSLPVYILRIWNVSSNMTQFSKLRCYPNCPTTQTECANAQLIVKLREHREAVSSFICFFLSQTCENWSLVFECTFWAYKGGPHEQILAARAGMNMD